MSVAQPLSSNNLPRETRSQAGDCHSIIEMSRTAAILNTNKHCHTWHSHSGSGCSGNLGSVLDVIFRSWPAQIKAELYCLLTR